MDKAKFKISVITVCRNEAGTIRQTILSVIQQDYCNVEYIIVDGKSTDNTIEIINQYRDKIAIFISERDNGVYDAMNKGLELASGDVVVFLNANDTFYSSSILSTIVELFNKSSSDIVYGNALMTGKNEHSGAVIRYDKINKWYLLRNTICHQAIFSKKKLYDDIGKFNLQFKIAADYEWLLRALIKFKAKATHLDAVVCNYSLDGMSSDPKYRSSILAEYDVIAAKYFNPFLLLVKKAYNYFLAVGYKVYSFLRKSK